MKFTDLDQRVWRVGFLPQPWEWSDWRWAGPDGRFNGRWDPPGHGLYRTVHAALRNKCHSRVAAGQLLERTSLPPEQLHRSDTGCRPKCPVCNLLLAAGHGRHHSSLGNGGPLPVAFGIDCCRDAKHDGCTDGSTEGYEYCPDHPQPA